MVCPQKWLPIGYRSSAVQGSSPAKDRRYTVIPRNQPINSVLAFESRRKDSDVPSLRSQSVHRQTLRSGWFWWPESVVWVRSVLWRCWVGDMKGFRSVKTRLNYPQMTSFGELCQTSRNLRKRTLVNQKLRVRVDSKEREKLCIELGVQDCQKLLVWAMSVMK